MNELKLIHGAKLSLIVLSLSACAAYEPKAPSAGGEQTQCPEPRPQVCTADYRPVCAELKNGELKTYSNGCTACGDAEVISHRPGACE